MHSHQWRINDMYQFVMWKNSLAAFLTVNRVAIQIFFLRLPIKKQFFWETNLLTCRKCPTEILLRDIRVDIPFRVTPSCGIQRSTFQCDACHRAGRAGGRSRPLLKPYNNERRRNTTLINYIVQPLSQLHYLNKKDNKYLVKQ